MKAQIKNLWRNRKAIWKAMGTIGEADFEPHLIGWHHWTFSKGTLMKDGVETPEDCTLSMWIKREGDNKKFEGKL